MLQDLYDASFVPIKYIELSGQVFFPVMSWDYGTYLLIFSPTSTLLSVFCLLKLFSSLTQIKSSAL